MTRRGFAQFFGKTAVGIWALGSLLETSGCFLSTVYTDIEKYAPVALAAFSSIISILTGAGYAIPPALSGIITLVKAAIADLEALIEQYQSAPSAQKKTMVGKISTALADVEANIQQFWGNLAIPDSKLAATVQGLLGIIVSTLLGFASQLPAPTANTPAMGRRAQLSNTLSVTPQKRSLGKFRSDFNAELAKHGHSDQKI